MINRKAAWVLASLGIALFSQISSAATSDDGEFAPPISPGGNGTITFAGKVVASTCTINGNETGSKDFTVTLPTVGTDTLSAKGATAGRTQFFISLSGCASKGSVHAYFEPGPTVDLDSGALKLDKGGAANVEIMLLSKDSRPIALSLPDNLLPNNNPVPIASDGTADLRYFAQYVALGKAGAGDAHSSITYSLVYQ